MNKSVTNRIHENFEINEYAQEERIKLLRQERYFPEAESCYLDMGGKHCAVVNYSTFGVVIECATDFLCEEENYDVPFVYNHVEIAQLHIRQIRRESQDNGSDVIAFELIGEPINRDKLEAVNAAQRVIEQQHDYVQSADNVPVEVKAQVYEVADWLEYLMSQIDEIEQNIKHTNYQSVLDYEETIIGMVAKYMARVFPDVLNAFNHVIDNQTEQARRHSINFLRQKLNHLIYQAPFAERVYTKPLGYAGDYEMMNLIYKKENIGKSLFARCLQRYYIDEPAAQAVRNRADYLIGVISQELEKASTERPFRMLSVACGPAMEWQRMLPEFHARDKQVIVDLLDQDKQALLSTQNRLRHLGSQYPAPVDFQFLHKAIKNIIVRGTEYKEYDLIYSAGLFDYLSDPVAYMAAEQLFRSVRPGGKLVIGNFNVGNPTQVVMDFALDWELIYRSEQDLLQLFEKLGGTVIVEREPLDINLFCVITKTE
jgi:extracellular factor (EF) 3-hydroxypalmitic acid methyl ester biosynthesis protein